MRPNQILPKLPPHAKILFIRLRSLGDTVLTTPLYASLKAWRPDLRIAVLVEKPYDEVLRHNPNLDQIFSIPDSKGMGRRLMARWEVLRAIRQKQFDLCINLHGGSTSAYFTWFSAAKFRIGLKSYRHRIAYNLQVENPFRTDRKWHTVEYQIELLRCLGLPEMEIPPLQIAPRPLPETGYPAKLQRSGFNLKSLYCVIQPASKFITKEWTTSGFAEIADFLTEKYGLQVILTGRINERATLEKVVLASRFQPLMLEKLSISELIEVLSQARLFVGNDSGPAHMATALGIPVVVLYGSSDSQVWHPWKGRSQIVQNPFACNPCPGYHCLVYGEPRCILSITPGQVKQAITALLGLPPV